MPTGFDNRGPAATLKLVNTWAGQENAVFLASDDATYITGHTLVVDGGLLVQQRSATVDIFPLSRFPKLEAE